jgi:cell division protease FtsH
MVTRWGMSEKLGPVTLAPRDDPFLGGQPGLGGFGGSRPYSETTAELIDAEVQRILQGCYENAVRLIRDHREALDSLARALLEHETLDEQEIIRVTGIHPAPRSESEPLPMPVAAFTGA